jgi:DNA-binding HxlR family transcriptional regulator
MARSKNYHHYCPVARSLEVIGEKWSLLVVRDLLRGPQRFSDLLRYLGGITPKWLTLRLRDLEAAGIVQRDSEPGRREVWYSLTDKGRDLAPVIQGLLVWGVDHALRPPEPGEIVHPEQTLYAMAAYMNSRQIKPSHLVHWRLEATEGGSYSLFFNGERWRTKAPSGHDPDVVVRASREAWGRFISSPRTERRLDELELKGEPERVAEFRNTFAAHEEPVSV